MMNTSDRDHTELVVALALGGDCLAEVGMLRAKLELAGPVASDPVDLGASSP